MEKTGIQSWPVQLVLLIRRAGRPGASVTSPVWVFLSVNAVSSVFSSFSELPQITFDQPKASNLPSKLYTQTLRARTDQQIWIALLKKCITWIFINARCVCWALQPGGARASNKTNFFQEKNNNSVGWDHCFNLYTVISRTGVFNLPFTCSFKIGVQAF